jgi:hypothetical protein
MKDQETLRKELSAPLPAEAVKPHPTKTYLSSIKAIYVTERLNTVFGIGKWTLKVDKIERAEGGTVVVKATLEIPEYSIYLESYGGNDNGGENSKNFDLGDAYKGATTDAITKICSYLEIGIDVFKGLKTPPTPKADNRLLWLKPNTEAWTKAIPYLKGGGTIADIKEKYNLTEENEKELLKQAI